MDTKILDMICTFPNVHWTVSVESIEEEFEYIRYGGKWADFVDNLTIIKNLEHKISFNMLHFLLNYQSLFTCIEFLQGMGFHPNSFVVGQLLNSDYLNIYNLPGKFQNEHEAYQRTGKKCRKKNCQGVIIRKMVNGRSAHFCSIHQI